MIIDHLIVNDRGLIGHGNLREIIKMQNKNLCGYDNIYVTFMQTLIMSSAFYCFVRIV